MNELEFIRAGVNDFEQIWPIFQDVIQSGDTYAFDPEMSKSEAEKVWIGQNYFTYIVKKGPEIVGTFMMKANQPGLGNHIANAGYMVSANSRNQGIGRQMAEFSFGEAKRLGFTAMQYNFVVSSNVGAVELWKRLGFRIIGTVPNGFRHIDLGHVDAYIMYKEL